MKEEEDIEGLWHPSGLPVSLVEITARELDLFIESMGEKAFCSLAAKTLVASIRPEMALTGKLARFRLSVRDGIVFFLSRVSCKRLREAILSQIGLPRECSSGERLLDLARHFPTLQKLGQVIARRPGLDPGLRTWLIRLETGEARSLPGDIHGRITDQLPEDVASRIQLSSYILAEASVAAIVSFTIKEKHGLEESTGVFKVLKRDIGLHLTEELRLMAETVAFLEKDRSRYGLKKMMLTELFTKVRDSLKREIDLEAERKNLVEAERIYGEAAGVVIPCLFPFKVPYLTAMEYIDGVPVTELKLEPEQRNALARRIFQTIICQPLFSNDECALFHGDPHAGNILAVSDAPAKVPAVALIDWTLAGRLPKARRAQLMEMMVGVITGDHRKIRDAVGRLCGESAGSMEIEELLAASFHHDDDPLKTAFYLLEEMTMAGLVLPPELILFHKAFFTLEGVVNDLSPGFSMAEAMSDYLGRLILTELPRRISTALLPVADSALGYRSLLSNEEVANLALYQTFTVLNKAMTSQFAIFDAQARFSAAILASMVPVPQLSYHF